MKKIKFSLVKVIVYLFVIVFTFSFQLAIAGINDSAFWLAGTNSGLQYSTDEGSTWGDTTGAPLSVFAIAQNGSIWLAGTQVGGDLYYSTDGIDWTSLGYHTGASGTRYITGIAWNGTRWVAVGYPAGFLYSDDGTTWSSKVNTIIGNTIAVASNGSRFVAVGGGIAYSDNGADWTSASNNPIDTSVNHIASNGSRWVAVGRGASHIAYSDDNGVSWTGALTLGCSNCTVYQVAWNGSKFVAVTNDDTHRVYHSADGITWTGLGDVFGGGGYGYTIAWNGTNFIAGGQYGTTGTLMRSTNGTDWTSLGTTYSRVDSVASAPAPSMFPAQVSDSTAPTVSTFSPADGATGVSTTANLVLTFDESVDVETGNIVIYKSSVDSVFETIDVTSGLVTGTGTDTITINPSGTLAESTAYYVQIAATAFDDTAGNSYAGITDETTWNFTTGDFTAPTVSTLSPADGASNISVISDLVITFSETVDVETGNITIKKISDGSISEIIDVTSGNVTGTGTNTITINPVGSLAEQTDYYVQIAATAFDDTSGNSYAGIADSLTWNFTTRTSANGVIFSGPADQLPWYVAPRPQIIYPDGTIKYLDAGSTTSTSTPPSTSTTTPLFVTPVPVNTFTFLKNLSVGIRHSEVKELQKFLNSQGFVLAESGPGSKGSETDYFGPLTFAALKKFQQNYSKEILTPAGLTNATGYFGKFTRDFVNGILRRGE